MIENVLGKVDKYYLNFNLTKGPMQKIDIGAKRVLFLKKGTKISNWLFNFAERGLKLSKERRNVS